jgi:hypothetical protein
MSVKEIYFSIKEVKNAEMSGRDGIAVEEHLNLVKRGNKRFDARYKKNTAVRLRN